MNDPPRVVSLVPSITETLLSWGVEPVAVTRFCEAGGIATVGGTKNPDISSIVSLAPSIVFMDEEENRVEDAQALRDAGVAVHATCVRDVAGVAAALADMARIVGVRCTSPARYGHGTPGLRVWVPIWRRPWMTINGDTYGSDLLALAGFDNVFSDSGDRYPVVSVEDARARDPEVVLAPSEPYRFRERHRAELEKVARVEFVDGRDLFWWGARTAGAILRMRALAARLARR